LNSTPGLRPEEELLPVNLVLLSEEDMELGTEVALLASMEPLPPSPWLTSSRRFVLGYQCRMLNRLRRYSRAKGAITRRYNRVTRSLARATAQLTEGFETMIAVGEVFTDLALKDPVV
jgi:hypothetical protein